MRDLIKKILKESEDDLEWAKDLFDSLSTELPRYDGRYSGKIYVIRFIQNTPKETFLRFNDEIVRLGWQPLSDRSIDTITERSEDSDEVYVRLLLDGSVTFGSSKKVFAMVSPIPMNVLPNIWYLP